MKSKCTHLRFEFRLVFLIALFFGLSSVQGITDPSDGIILHFRNVYVYVRVEFCFLVDFCVVMCSYGKISIN